ncbi:MAG: SDR family NAD(P)-dependent oxidoreductase [Xanthobacteraceae bacterium]
MDLQGKTVLVTGASSGIGKAISIAFAQKRAHVLVHFGKNKSGAQATLDEVKATSSGSLYQADLMNRDRIAALFAEIAKTNRTIDVLVNNAGDARAGEIGDDDVWDYEYKNIFMSAVQMSTEFLALPSTNLRKIINVTSLYGNLQTGEPHYLQYSAFKAALANLSATLNKSSAPNVIVNAIAPGYTQTPAWTGAPPEAIEACARATSIGRFVRPEEVAHAAVFIAENDALVGQVVTLDGGTSLIGMA